MADENYTGDMEIEMTIELLTRYMRLLEQAFVRVDVWEYNSLDDVYTCKVCGGEYTNTSSEEMSGHRADCIWASLRKQYHMPLF